MNRNQIDKTERREEVAENFKAASNTVFLAPKGKFKSK